MSATAPRWRPGPRTARKRALALHADHRAPRGPGPERRGAQAAGRPLCVTGLRARPAGSGQADSESAKKAAAVNPACPPPGGSPPPALTLGLHAYFQPTPAREGLPELVSPAPSGGPPGKPGASQGVQGPATESGRSFSDPVSRHGPELGRGARTPHTGLQRGSTEGPLNKQDERCFPAAPSQ